MRTIFLFLICITSTNLFAQTTTQIYGKVTKSDGTRIKGTSVMRGYEDQLLVVNLTGGVDHSASIELEVPTGGYMAIFRSMLGAAPTRTIAAKPVAVTTVKSANVSIAALPSKSISTASLQTFPISRIEISVTGRVNNELPVLSRQIILEDVKIESCTDDFASGNSKIKFKANRIGWIYINRGADGKVRSTDKSGWDVVTDTAWTNF